MIYLIKVDDEKFITAKNSFLYKSAKKNEGKALFKEYKDLSKAIKENPEAILDDCKDINYICRDIVLKKASKSKSKSKSKSNKFGKLDIVFYVGLIIVALALMIGKDSYDTKIVSVCFFGLWAMLICIFIQIKENLNK